MVFFFASEAGWNNADMLSKAIPALLQTFKSITFIQRNVNLASEKELVTIAEVKAIVD